MAPLPRVTAKSKTPEGMASLRQNTRERGLPELVHPAIAASCLRKSPSDTIDAAMFNDIALALRQMFSRWGFGSAEHKCKSNTSLKKRHQLTKL